MMLMYYFCFIFVKSVISGRDVTIIDDDLPLISQSHLNAPLNTKSLSTSDSLSSISLTQEMLQGVHLNT